MAARRRGRASSSAARGITPASQGSYVGQAFQPDGLNPVRLENLTYSLASVTRPVKTIELPRASQEVASLLDRARDEDLILRLPDGSEFLVIACDDFDEEIVRTRKNPKLMAMLEQRARQTATIPLDEVKRRLGV